MSELEKLIKKWRNRRKRLHKEVSNLSFKVEANKRLKIEIFGKFNEIDKCTMELRRAITLHDENWINIKDRLPDRDTKYAAKYGVSVLCYDRGEEKSSGYYTPTECTFNFEKNIFETLHYSFGKGLPRLLPVDITHWKELPDIPKLN